MTLRESIKKIIQDPDNMFDEDSATAAILSLIRERVEKVDNPYIGDFYDTRTEPFGECRRAILKELKE